MKNVTTSEERCAAIVGGLKCGWPKSHDIHRKLGLSDLCHPYEPPAPPVGERGWCRKCRHRAHEGGKCASGPTGDECPCPYEESDVRPTRQEATEAARWLRETADYNTNAGLSDWQRERLRSIASLLEHTATASREALTWIHCDCFAGDPSGSCPFNSGVKHMKHVVALLERLGGRDGE